MTPPRLNANRLLFAWMAHHMSSARFITALLGCFAVAFPTFARTGCCCAGELFGGENRVDLCTGKCCASMTVMPSDSNCIDHKRVSCCSCECGSGLRPEAVVEPTFSRPVLLGDWCAAGGKSEANLSFDVQFQGGRLGMITDHNRRQAMLGVWLK